MPLRSGCADLLLSSSTFQWLPDLTLPFVEARRVLQPGGWFVFALFGEGTLLELRESYRWAVGKLGCGYDRTHVFHTRSDVTTALTAAGFSNCRVWNEHEEERYPDVPDLLRAVRSIGAGNAVPRRGGSLVERRVMLTMMDRYRAVYGGTSGIPASYEVIYGVARSSE